jgi:hypothetical protein
VRFSLEYRESVREYLRNLPLTREGRVRLYALLIERIAEVSDSFRSDSANRVGPKSALFHTRLIFADSGHTWRIRVVVDDSTAAYGVLRVVFIECT